MLTQQMIQPEDQRVVLVDDWSEQPRKGPKSGSVFQQSEFVTESHDALKKCSQRCALRGTHMYCNDQI